MSLISDYHVDSFNLEQPAVCSPEGDHGHLAGQAGDLLHKEGKLGSPGLPVFHLYILL